MFSKFFHFFKNISFYDISLGDWNKLIKKRVIILLRNKFKKMNDYKRNNLKVTLKYILSFFILFIYTEICIIYILFLRLIVYGNYKHFLIFFFSF
jgi:hypothetical protein